MAMPFDDSLRFNDEKSGAPILPALCQGDPKQSILKTKGRPFSCAVEDCQLLAKGEDFRHQFQSRRKKGASKENEKREESHIEESHIKEAGPGKLNSECQFVVSMDSSCKCKRLKVGWDFR